jgi:hypothetical protein
MWLELSNLSIASFPLCVCTHPIDLMGIHVLHCAHGNEHTWTHDVIHYTFATIVGAIAFTHKQIVVTNVWFCIFIYFKNKKYSQVELFSHNVIFNVLVDIL